MKISTFSIFFHLVTVFQKKTSNTRSSFDYKCCNKKLSFDILVRVLHILEQFHEY